MKRIIIFEGPDGSGKTHAATLFAKKTGAAYHHHPAYTGVTDVMPIYLTSMMPAVTGLCDVVLDRCWLSEKPYGYVYRAGVLRISTVDQEALEAVAHRQRAVVVRCLPPWAKCRESFIARKALKQEYLDDDSQLRAVFDEYRQLTSSLRILEHDWTIDADLTQLFRRLEVNP